MKKEILIFGSNGALGKGVTDSFLKKDYNKYYLFDFHPRIKNGNNIVQLEVNDLSVEENVKKAFENINPSKETAYFLFSTVGGFAGGKSVWETDYLDWDKMMAINLKTSFLISKYFSILVKNSHSGSICFTAAFTGLSAEPKKAAYGASKSALIHLVETLAEEGKEIRLSANAVAPYIIDTPANRDWMKNSDFESWIIPEEVGEFIHSIFTNYHFITGNIFKLTHRFSFK